VRLTAQWEVVVIHLIMLAVSLVMLYAAVVYLPVRPDACRLS